MKVAFRKKCHTIYSRIICFWTFGKFSHSELVFSDGKSFSSDESDGGTRWKDSIMTAEEWDFIEVPCTKSQEKEIRRFCEGEDGLQYDMVGIGFSFLPIPIGWQTAEKWFCSEICVAALQQIGYLTGYTPSRISPNKLYKILKNERRFRIKSLPLSVVTFTLALLLSSIPAFAHDCGCQSTDRYKRELQQKLDMARANAELLADILASMPATEPPDTRANALEEYRYWSDRWEYYIIEINKAEREW